MYKTSKRVFLNKNRVLWNIPIFSPTLCVVNLCYQEDGLETGIRFKN